MYQTELEKNRKYDNLCFAVTTYILFGVGAIMYGNEKGYPQDNFDMKKNNIEAILVEDSESIMRKVNREF
ncbi:MAG: hypothetical protein ACP5N1_05085 [Candidatus Woesearchaeota archaeon]